MIDMNHGGALVAALHESEQSRPADPNLPLRLEQARKEVEAAFAPFERKPGWFQEVSQGGLLAAGLRSLTRLLEERE
jgi:hypothetical protein